MNFLRTNVRSPRDSSLGRQSYRPQRSLANNEDDRMDLDDPWGMGMTTGTSSRIHWVNRQRDELSSLPNYEGRLPDLSSLYGWAPSPGDDDLAVELLQEWFRSDTESTRSGTLRRDARRDASNRISQQRPTDDSYSHRMNDGFIPNEILLQSMRRPVRFSRTRTLHNYLLERDRERDRESEDRDRPAAATSRAYRYLPASRSESRVSSHSDLRSRINAHRRSFLDHPPSPRLKETIKYLERLRYSTTYEESLTAATSGFIQLDYLACNQDDFVLDTASIAPPTECSWLRPGIVFSGSQRAARSGHPMYLHRPPSSNEPVIVNGGETGRVQVRISPGRRHLPQNLYRLGDNKEENWPVKVTIHSVNYDDMTLSGTMEACNIPDKTSSTPGTHIITFLEGEIIDFNRFTLETGKFRADAETDSTYWRELQPFRDLTDDEIVKSLVSKRWIAEELSKRWLLMRWKGMQAVFIFFRRC